MKVVLGYIAWSEYARNWHEGLVNRARQFGWDVEAFCLTPKGFAPRCTFQVLDRLWQTRQPDLVRMYRRLKSALVGADVFWIFNGANVHPAWLQEFDCLNVYSCFDDPESSADISKPVAPYSDTCLIGNLSCGPLYESWGVHSHAWAPLGFVGDDYNSKLTPEQVLDEDRPIDFVFFGEREGFCRRDRLNRLAHEFPNAMFRGRGWPEGYVSVAERQRAYRQAKIGWNIHNSVGPVNLRFFALLANGIMQLCDNKCRIGQVLDLNKEIVGFDTIEECIELSHYYLNHEDERRRIAANGLRRYQHEFTEEKLWEYYFEKFRGWINEKDKLKENTPRYSFPKRRKQFEISFHGMFMIGQAVADRFGYEIRNKQTLNNQEPTQGEHPYVENSEVGGINLAEKEKRRAAGGHFEWPNMVVLNWACTKLIGNAENILDIGGGTGCFAYEASAIPERKIVCVDMDEDVINWAKRNRSRENITYIAGQLPEDSGPFDLVVAIDVVEHVKDFYSFLHTCCHHASRAIFTTPNKQRDESSDTIGPPSYYQHVREWTAGEFYWVLRSFYKNVNLYAMSDLYVPEICSIDVKSKLTPLIAECSEPLLKAKNIQSSEKASV